MAAADQIVLQVHAVSLNRGEVRGSTRAAEGRVPGWDVAGTVLEPAKHSAGPCTGTRVVAMIDGGGWAERVADPRYARRSFPRASVSTSRRTLPIAGLTVVRAIALAAPRKGKRILITGGSGGVGQFAVQLAAREGAEVSAISSRTARHEA